MFSDAALRRPPDLACDDALFLDFDGTLVELAATPDSVRVAPEVPRLLAALSDWLGGAVAVVSGRPVADLLRLLAPFSGVMAGQHGSELRHGDGRLSRRKRDPALTRNHAALARLAARHRGVMLEDKGNTLALHYRQAPGFGAACRAAVRRAALASAGRLRAIDGKRVIELMPRGVGKGAAIAALSAAPPFHGRTPVFVGDDVTDEDGFAAIERLGGISIRVGAGPSAARYRLADEHDVAAWLAQSIGR
ncbi:MAG TPA: trehalose-phosphatase [Stellaceae bacterium]|nr:trehalose-phosphatase [Stellaceae bacterium]